MSFQHNSLVVYVLCDIHSTCTHTRRRLTMYCYEQQLGRPTLAECRPSRVGLELHERSYEAAHSSSSSLCLCYTDTVETFWENGIK